MTDQCLFCTGGEILLRASCPEEMLAILVDALVPLYTQATNHLLGCADMFVGIYGAIARPVPEAQA